MELDLLAIGDVTIDAFIRITDAEVHCDLNRERCTLSMRFAEKIPYESVTILAGVGNSPNAAVSASKLGLRSALVSNVGDDEHGRDCVSSLEKHGVNTSLISRDPTARTNYHYVLWYEDERTILVKHEEYRYKVPADVPVPKWVYLSSLGENSLPYHGEILQYLKSNPDIKLAFQPGTYQMKLGAEKLSGLYERSEAFFCNVEEARRILSEPDASIQVLLKKMHTLGPKIVAITDGPKGAYASDGRSEYFMPIYPDPKPPIERTGAGDAFASTFVAAIILGNNFEDALRWAPINPMNVVQDVGAQTGLLSRAELSELLSKAPADYAPRPL